MSRSLLIPMLLAATLSAGPALGQPQPAAPDKAEAETAERIANGARFGAWTVTCEAVAVDETACVLSQRLVRSSGSTFLAELLAFWNADRSRSYLAARVPIGVFFPSGFVLKPEGSEERFEFVWQACSRELCEALLEIDMEKLGAVDAAREAVIGYRPGLRAEPLVFKTGTNGVVEGLEALRAAMRK